MDNQKFKEKAINIKNDIVDKASLYFDGKKHKELAKAVIIFSIKGILASIYAFLLASTACLFGTYPLGLCLLCSASSNVLFIYLGCSAAALFGQSSLSLAHLVIYTLVIVMRFLVCKWVYPETKALFEEGISIRSIIALIGGFGGGVYFCIIDGFSIYSLGGLIFTCAVSLALTAILGGLSQKDHSFYRQAAYCAIGFCLINALSHYSIFGFSLAFASCTCLCLYSALTRDIFRSTIFSLVCGFACGEPAIAPMFAIMALFCSLARKFKEKSALPAGILTALAYAFWAYGITAVTYVVPDVVCGALLVIPIRYFSNITSKSETKDNKEEYGYDLRQSMAEAAKKDSQTMSLALDSLASVLNDLSNRLKRPDIGALKEMSDSVYRNNCLKCKLCSLCSMAHTNNGNSSMENLFSLHSANALFDKGYVSMEDMPPRFADTCKNSKDIIYSINDQYGDLLRKLSTDDKTKAFAAGYSAVSRLIEEGEKRRDEEHTVDKELSQSAMGLCRELNISPSSVYIYGNRKKNVVIKGKGNIPISSAKLKEAFSNLCKTPLSTPFTENMDDNWKITMETIPVLQIEMGYSTKNCQGEDVCGDHVCTFNSNDGYSYAVLSDGMGSGRQAALVSTICCTFVENLSVCGGSLKTVLETINSYILNQSYECSATLDLLRVDSYKAMGCFVKSGAVSSMVIRGGHVFRISSATVPIGVVRELNSEQISLPLKPGDFIVMTSDGVTPDFESGLFAADITTKYANLPPREIAEKIISAASSSGRRPDDMSCVVIKIKGYDKN